MSQYSVVGKRAPRLDGAVKATGQAQYMQDIKLPGMLHAKILRSPHPHARILNIDTSRAQRLSGVKCVLTGEDVPSIPVGQKGPLGDNNRYVLARGKVRYIGDEQAAVAAIDPDIAREAIELIKVDYEELPAIFDPEEAIRPDAPQIHEDSPGNIAVQIKRSYGHVDEAFSDSDFILEDRFTTQPQSHACPELRAWIADVDSSGKVTLWSASQLPQVHRFYVASLLGMNPNNIRIVIPFIGGSFGSKGGFGQMPLVILLAQRTGKPVKLQYDRTEEFTVTGHRYPVAVRIKTGVKKEGRIVAWDYHCLLDSGAYFMAEGLILALGGREAYTLYNVPNVRFEGYAAYTNKPWGCWTRALGRPQAVFALESAVDMVAERLGMNPMEFRLKNANRPNTVMCDGRQITTCGMSECIQRAADLSNWKQKRGKQPGRGLGIACLASGSGGGKMPPQNQNFAASVVTIDEFANVTLLLGEPDPGSGGGTTIAQIAAEELGVALEDVQIATGDTELVPLPSWGAHGSRVTFCSGNAAKLAAADAKRQLFEVVADLLEANIDDLEARDRKIMVKGSPQKSMAFAEAVNAYYKKTSRPLMGRGQFDDPYSTPVEKGGWPPVYTFAAQIAEVEVDKDTGNVKVLNFVAAQDLGYPINPNGAEGQLEGGAAMGMGFALLEELKYVDGRTTNPNYVDYRTMTALDTPPIACILVETNDPKGPFGAKGIGEPVTVPTAAAVANAIYDAVGVRVKDLPITPEKILQALREKEAENVAHHH